MRLRLLLGGVVAPLVLWAFLPAVSPATPLSTIQRKIESTQGMIGRKKGTERVLTTDIARYSRRIGKLQGKIGSLSARQARLQADLDRKRSRLVATQASLRKERARLVRLRARLAVARRQLAERMVELYTADRPDLVTVVLNAKGFADLLEREEFLGRINAQDRDVVRTVRAARVDATATAERLDALERRQQRITAAVLARRDEIAEVRGELIGTRVGYQRTRAGKAAALAKTRSRRTRLEDTLESMQREQAQIQGTLQRASAASSAGDAGPIRQGSGDWIWPLNGPITTLYGAPRPGRTHAGIDIAGPEGAPIRAVDSGRVVLAGWTGGYGLYTCIQHSASLSSCYAHQVRLGTTKGASVSQGQVIGFVGNTGVSFGNHLHFEARVNGTPVDPNTYL